MRELLTADDLFAHLMILRGVSNKRFILVEGDDDFGMIDPHLDEKVCETLPTGGKSVVLRAAEIAQEQGVTGVGVVLDLDWADLLYPRFQRSYVFYTDFYDIDATAFAPRQSVIGVITNSVKREKLRECAQDGMGSLLESIVEAAKFVGILRFLSERNRWELHLRDFPVHLVIGEGFHIDLDRLASVVMQRSPRAQIEIEILLSRLKEESLKVHDSYRYCSGHDLLAATAAIIRKIGGQVSSKSVGASLRSAFSCHDVSSSKLFSDIANWGQSQGVKLLTCT
ncbi:hypothetical protein [Streptomyces sp. NPDC048612]|uniref:hypothetical protein n=1 Tax=Streptomyces sp. NPDC048612 TaxID=3365579 RepID=UPI00371FB6AE